MQQYPDHLPLLSEALSYRCRRAAAAKAAAEKPASAEDQAPRQDSTTFTTLPDGGASVDQAAHSVQQDADTETLPPQLPSPSPPPMQSPGEAAAAVCSAADAVIAAIDQESLSRHVARKCPEEGPGSAARTKEFEEQKAALIAALAAKVSALLDVEDAEGGSKAQGANGKTEDPIEATFGDLRKWCDTLDSAHAVLHSRREQRAGRFASALRALKKASSEGDVIEAAVVQQRAQLYEALGWSHLARAERGVLIRSFPVKYPLF